MPTALDLLGAAKYMLLTTYRKDGRAVATPVWVARDGDELVVFTAPDTGKVKRIRRNGAVEVAPCDMRGNRKGEDVPGRARILDEAGARRTLRLIMRKYWILGPLTVLGGRLRRRGGLPGAIAITLN